MHDPADVTGLILAGGRPDAALGAVAGVPSVALVHAALAAHAGEVLVATGAGPGAYPVAARLVPRAAPDAGPLAGLVAGLEAAATPWVLSAAVDLPYLTPAALRPLLAAATVGVDALVAVDAAGRRQPTVALWRTRTAAPAARGHLTQRLALGALLDRLAVREVTVEGGALRRADGPGGA